jgi:hypothetical protein
MILWWLVGQHKLLTVLHGGHGPFAVADVFFQALSQEDLQERPA